MQRAPEFSDIEREAVYRAIANRRDVRRGFTSEALPETILHRLLAAAHSAPSVGLMQPSRFVVIRNLETRRSIHRAFLEANERALATYSGARREQYANLKLEGILDAPQNLCVLSDTGSARGHGLGRHTMPETGIYSTVCAVQNLWLAARAEGVGMGWVSILDPDATRRILRIPDHIEPVAYLCLGYVDSFAVAPDLERFGWEQRLPVESVISYETYADPCATPCSQEASTVRR